MAAVAVNVYIVIVKRRISVAGAFLGALTIPTFFSSFLLVSAYLNGLAVWVPPFPIVPFEATYMVFALCILIFGLSIFVYFEPGRIKMTFRMRWQHQHTSTLNPDLNPTDDPKEGEKGGENVGEAE